MKNYFVGLGLILFCLMNFALGQKQDETKYRKISDMIGYSQRTTGIFENLLGRTGTPETGESTVLSSINFPNQVKVEYLAETQKMSKERKKIAEKWLKEYAEQPSMRYFYVNEIQVEEDGVKYWIMAHENTVITKLKNFTKKNDEVILNLKILGYRKSGKTIEYYLLVDGVK